MFPSFEGQCAVVTGGASGIGKETALVLAERGASVLVLADRQQEAAEQAAAEIEQATGRRCLPARLDVADPASVEALFQFVTAECGDLHILVNGAGVCPYLPIEEVDAERWDRTVDINLRGSFLCAREAFKRMKPRRFGKIVNIASVAARIGGLASGVDYVASKGGVVSMTYSFAKAGTPFGINVNGVAPGVIATPLSAAQEYPPGTIIGQARDVANVIAFLASEDARHVQGCTIDVTGGLYMH